MWWAGAAGGQVRQVGRRGSRGRHMAAQHERPRRHACLLAGASRQHAAPHKPAAQQQARLTEDLVQLLHRGLGPDAEAAQVATGCQLRHSTGQAGRAGRSANVCRVDRKSTSGSAHASLRCCQLLRLAPCAGLNRRTPAHACIIGLPQCQMQRQTSRRHCWQAPVARASANGAATQAQAAPTEQSNPVHLQQVQAVH